MNKEISRQDNILLQEITKILDAKLSNGKTRREVANRAIKSMENTPNEVQKMLKYLNERNIL